jgi:hypothetical protein
LHGATEDRSAPTRVINYTPVLQQALRDLSAWVEKGTLPAANSTYQVANGQVAISADPDDRGGVQPLVTLRANGGKRAEVKRGEKVKLAGRISVPNKVGYVVAAEWDLDGSGAFADKAQIGRMVRKADVAKEFSFDTPGTYFITLRGFSQRNGDQTTPFARIPNLARVRVVVK